MKAHHEQAGHAVNAEGAKHAHDLLIGAQATGGQFLVGGAEMIGWASVRPTIVVNVTEKSRIWDEETFGPSASLYVLDYEQQAIELASSSVYGLTASIHTTDLERALRLVKRLEYGQVHINSITEFEEGATDPRKISHLRLFIVLIVTSIVTAPVGGVKASGWGRNNSHWGLGEFLVDKMVSMHGEGSEATFG